MKWKWKLLSHVLLFCGPMDRRPPGSCVGEILQARIRLQGIFPTQGSNLGLCDMKVSNNQVFADFLYSFYFTEFCLHYFSLTTYSGCNLFSFSVSLFKICLFRLFLVAQGLCCCVQTFSSCSKQGLLFAAVQGLLAVVAPLCRAWAPGTRASAVVACGLESVGSVVVVHGLSWSVACGIFPDQGSSTSLHWQVDVQQRDHQGSSRNFLRQN